MNGVRTMTQQAAAVSAETSTPDQMRHRLAMLERFNHRAMLNAQDFAEKMRRIQALANMARNNHPTLPNMTGIIGAIEELAEKGVDEAELDSKCMKYALTLGPDDVEELEQLMGTGEVVELRH
jgi:predicted lipoprotein